MECINKKWLESEWILNKWNSVCIHVYSEYTTEWTCLWVNSSDYVSAPSIRTVFSAMRMWRRQKMAVQKLRTCTLRHLTLFVICRPQNWGYQHQTWNVRKLRVFFYFADSTECDIDNTANDKTNSRIIFHMFRESIFFLTTSFYLCFVVFYSRHYYYFIHN